MKLFTIGKDKRYGATLFRKAKEEEDEEKEEEEEEEEEEKKPKAKKSYHKEIIEFLQENPKPDDDDFHDFAEDLGVSPDSLEEQVYEILGSIVAGGIKIPSGKKFNSKELKMGIKVEMEHTSNPLIAERVAKQHLVEMDDYYTKLKKMEGGNK